METKTDFLRTVLDLFSKYGIKSVTMEDISKELGISKKTLYNFVSDKNELVENVIDFQCSEHSTWTKSMNLDKLPALEEVVQVSKIINKMIRDFNPSFQYDLAKYHYKTYKKMMKVNREAMAQSMLLNMKKGKEEGFYRSELNEELIVKMHIANAENLAEIDFYNSQKWSPEEIQHELFNYHMHAILNQKGIVEYQRLLNLETN